MPSGRRGSCGSPGVTLSRRLLLSVTVLVAFMHMFSRVTMADDFMVGGAFRLLSEVLEGQRSGEVQFSGVGKQATRLDQQQLESPSELEMDNMTLDRNETIRQPSINKTVCCCER